MIWVTRKPLLVKLHLLISFIYSTFAIEPLIFNPYSLDVFNVRAMYIYKSGISAYVAACPAVDGFEKDFNENFSLDHKSLIARGEKYKYYEDAEKIQCEKGFELSLLKLNKNPPGVPKGFSSLKLGYEVYYDKSKYPKDFKNMETSEYGEISKLLPKAERTVKVPGRGSSEINKDDTKKITQQDMGFVWFTKIGRIELNIKTWSINRMYHKLHLHADQIMQEVACENYDLGKELYSEETLDDFYSLENQKRIFENVKLPKSTLPSGDCQWKHRCVEKYNFVPPYVFQSSPSAPVSCSNLTTIAIWHEVSKPLLEQLDKFLVSMAQYTERRFVIVSGVHKTLALPSNTVFGRSKEIYLDSSKSRIPIPKIIYKIVRYRSYPCDLKETTCVYEVLIAIHNEPSFNEGDELCLEDKCLAWGFEKIQKYYSPTDKEWKKSDHIYCCKVDPKLMKKLGMLPETFKSGDLDLNNFVYDDEYASVHRVSNRKQQFEEVMDTLFPIDGSVDWQSIPDLNFKGEHNAIRLPEKVGWTNLTPKTDMQKIAAKRQKDRKSKASWQKDWRQNPKDD